MSDDAGQATGRPMGEEERPAVGTCPMCGSSGTRVEEDVSDEVTVYACGECGATWADRNEG